jgi:hypothetical protein
VGMQREFVVLQREDEDGQIVLSLAAVEVRRDKHEGWFGLFCSHGGLDVC